MSDELSTRVAARADQVASTRRELAAMTAELDRARDEIARCEDLLGVDESGRPLPIKPLVGMIFATAASLTAVVLAYVMGLMTLPMFRSHGMDSDAPAVGAGLIACSFVGAVGMFVGRRPGAGASARSLLRPVARVLLAVSLFCGAALYTYGTLR